MNQVPKTAFLGILAALLLWSGIPNSASWQWTFVGGAGWAGILVILSGIGICWGPRLGQDWIPAVAWLGLGIPVVMSHWPVQSAGAWWLLGLHGGAVYGVMAVARDPQQWRWLWRGLGVWAVLWSGISLGLWLTGWGQFLGQNAQPLGHPNYGAGYAVLLLPVVVALAWRERHWLWGLGIAGLAGALITTQSRGGGLGLALMAVGIVVQGLLGSRKHWCWGALGGLAALGLALANPRWRAMGGGSPYRQVVWTAVQGIIQDHLGLGTGPGTSAWVYPRYRPDWAGGEAEAVWQLHTTVGQVTAEVGLLGIGIVLGLGWWLWGRIKGGDRLWLTAVGYSGLGYSGLLLTDYQLDVAGITGLMVLLVAMTLAPQTLPPKTLPIPDPKRRWALGVLIVSLCLNLPRYGAWWISSNAYHHWASLPRQERSPHILIPALRRAEQWFPWDPLYPLTLGWLTGDPQDLQRAQSLAPHEEYLSTQLGWLFLTRDPAQALAQFQRSHDLVPSRLGIASGLGFAKLARGENGIPELVQDIIRHPHLVGSAWYGQYLTPAQQQDLRAAVLDRYATLIPQFPHHPFLPVHGAFVAWWWGDPERAATWNPGGSSFLDLLILADQGNRPQVQQRILQLPVSPATLLLMAWADPQHRSDWLAALGDPGLRELATTTLTGDPEIRSWLQHPLWQQTYLASRGYLVLGTYRRADMPIVSDRFGIPVHRLFQDIWQDWLSVPPFVPDLDRALIGIPKNPRN